MTSRKTKAFLDLYSALPANVQQQADDAFTLFQQNPYHPSLHFKHIQRGSKILHSVRISLHYRALALEKSGELYWF